MAQRRHHYEQAFEHYLRWRRIPYVAVDEAKKALLPQGADGAEGAPSAAALKSFDFVLYGSDTNLLVEIKGRRASGAGGAAAARRPRMECWVTQDDVASLRAWEGLFGGPFRAAFVFLYWCPDNPPAPLFEEVFEFHGRWYAIRSILVEDYAALMRPRSQKWRTVHLSTAAFDRASRSLCGPVPGRLLEVGA